MRCYIEKQGLSVTVYHEDKNLTELCMSDDNFDINENDIVDLTKQQLARIEDKEFRKGKRCYTTNLSSYTYEIPREKRVDKEIRKLEVDTEIEKYIKKIIKTPISKIKKKADEVSYRVDGYIRNDLYDVLTKYAKKNNKTTITISNVKMFAKSMRDYICPTELIRNIRRKGIYLYFKEDGIWTGNRELDIDLGVLIMLALCVNVD